MSSNAQVNALELNEDKEIDYLNQCFTRQKAAFAQNPYPSFEQRINDLLLLKKLIKDNETEIIEAMNADFGHRCEFESSFMDIAFSISAINYCIKNLKQWMKPDKRKVGIAFQPGSAEVMFQPKGIIGNIGPWNYPVMGGIYPLIPALAAGNSMIIKLSEFTINTHNVLKVLFKQYFSEDKVAFVNGKVAVSSAFTSIPFNHLFFTGSGRVGKLVMAAAAQNLTPVTLELGGKSPLIIDNDIDINVAVERFIFAKSINAGQTCVAPDHVFCPRNRINELVKAVKVKYQTMFPNFVNTPDITSIFNDTHFQRLQGLLKDATDKGGILHPMAEIDKELSSEKRRLPLTLITEVNHDMAIMQEEIFGSLLPILPYDNVDDVINTINAGDRPLALYINSFNKNFQNLILKSTHAGGVSINDAVFHVAIDDLPFGGTGASGMGRYGGIEGFKTFSNEKAILKRGKVSFAKFLFPPYNTKLHKMVLKFLKK